MLISLCRIPQFLKILALFFVVLAWFFCTPWYKQAFLVISGNAPEKDGQLEVSWESGGGANLYEFRRFMLDTISTKGDGRHSITIRNLGEKNSASLSTEVVCEKIALDGKVVDLVGIDLKGGLALDNNTIKLTNRGEEFHLDVEARESIDIKINSNNRSGKVEIIVDGKSQIFDLYRPQDNQMFSVFRYWIVGPTGEYRVRMEMPRYPIKSLTVANGKPESQLLVDHIEIEVGQKASVLFSGEKETLGTRFFRKVSALQKSYYHKTQFLFQLLFAALTTWLLTACWRIYARYKAAVVYFLENSASSGGFSCRPYRFFLFGCLHSGRVSCR